MVPLTSGVDGSPTLLTIKSFRVAELALRNSKVFKTVLELKVRHYVLGAIKV